MVTWPFECVKWEDLDPRAHHALPALEGAGACYDVHMARLLQSIGAPHIVMKATRPQHVEDYYDNAHIYTWSSLRQSPGKCPYSLHARVLITMPYLM